MDIDEKKEQRFIQLINQGIQEVVIPAMSSMEEELKSEFRRELKKEIGGLRSEMSSKFD